MRIPDKAYFNFSGGIRRDKSLYFLKDNELQRGRNFEIDEQGRIRKRKGSRQFGQTISGDPDILELHHDNNGFFLAIDSTATPIYRLASAVNTGAVATTDTTLAVSAGVFTTTGPDAELNGDLFGFTGGGNTTTLTGVTGLTSAHTARSSSVHEWRNITGTTDADGDEDVSFAYLNGLTIVIVSNGTITRMYTINSSFTVGVVSGEPTPANFLETFRDRVFTANGNTVYYSNLGNATSWPTTVADNSFDIEDTDGGTIRGLQQYRKNLLIFKQTSSYSYSGSLPVRQISSTRGIFNKNCVQEINGLIYGFGPNGIFVTNGVSVKNIGDSVREYYQDLNLGTITSATSIQFVFTGQWNNKFLIYMQDITGVETMSDVMLVYDTVKKSWEVWNGWTDMAMMKYLKRFNDGSDAAIQARPALFWSSGASLYKAFESRHIDNGVQPSTTIGGDLYADLFANTGSNIVFQVRTKPYDLGMPNYKKQFNYLKVFSERPQGLFLNAIIDEGNPIPLGQIKNKIERLKFPSNAKGYRCALELNESSTAPSLIFNGVIFEDCSTIDKNA